MRYILYTFFTILLVYGISCKKNELEKPTDISSKYLSLGVGQERTYQFDSVYYLGNGQKADSFSFEVKHSVVSESTDAVGNKLFNIEISAKRDTINGWVYVRTYTITVQSSFYLRTDFDLTEVILGKPVINDKVWDGNQYNQLDYSEFYIANAHEPQTFGSFSFDSTANVIQEESDNAIKQFTGLETYAANYGLVYREKRRMDFSNPSKPKGYYYYLRLINFEP